MEKIAILVDTASDIELEIANELGIYILPLYVNLNGEYLKDRKELSPKEFYNWVKENHTSAKTSTASPGDVLEMYEKIKADGYNKLLAISLSSKFSSTYNLLSMTRVEGLEIYVFDSASLTLAEGYFAMYAKELIEKGLSFDEICNKLDEKKDHSRVFFSIESFKHIVEGGRLPKSLGRVGDALSVRPILTVNPLEGAFKVAKITRGEKKVLAEFKKYAKAEIEGINEYYFFVGHGGYEEGARKLEKLFTDIIRGAKIYHRVEISPTLGANTGPGLLGFGLFKVD